MSKFMQFLKNHKTEFFSVGLIFILIYIIYFFYRSYSNVFSDVLPIENKRELWGQFGDFFGGLLNPIFSFFTIILLVVNLIQTKIDLKTSRDELILSNKILKEQTRTQFAQRFEGTFFPLISQLDSLLKNITALTEISTESGGRSLAISKIDNLRKDLTGDGEIPRLDGKYPSDLNKAKTMIWQSNPVINQYFRVLYQILKFIATNTPGSSLTPQSFNVESLTNTKASNEEVFYSNLVRSFIPENIYPILAINAYTDDPNNQYMSYRLLIERYHFFEHMRLDLLMKSRSPVIKIIQKYNHAAFGKNPTYNSFISHEIQV